MELHINKKSILVGVIYRPNTPPKADIDIFTHTMHDIQNILSRDQKETLIMGDMNIDLLKCTTHVKSQEYIDNSFSQGFIPLITKPTRVTDYTATLIDHLLYNRHDRTQYWCLIYPTIMAYLASYNIATRYTCQEILLIDHSMKQI